jgi:hypothetical protein
MKSGEISQTTEGLLGPSLLASKTEACLPGIVKGALGTNPEESPGD